MRSSRFHVAVACAAALGVFGCGKEQPGTGTAATTAAGATKVVAEKVAPYAYPAPVKGRVKEANIGEFELVDGIAYPAVSGAGTVVYVTSRPIASPMIVDSACPLTQARALSKLRNAGFGEVTLDAAGHSRYFAAGTAFGGSLTDLSTNSRAWMSTLKIDADHATGNVVHRQYGRFEFDLPLSSPKFDEISYGDREQKRRLPATTPKPTEQVVTAAYVALRDAALKKNLRALLAAQGFDAKQIAAIRGLEGIDADFMVYADRFLTPGTPSEAWGRAGSAQIRGEGVKSDGKKFVNDYYFDICGDHLVLTGIVENAN